jgi:hypothetical protein
MFPTIAERLREADYLGLVSINRTAYSLAGHVVLTVPNLPLAGGCPDNSLRNRIRELKRLRVSFEGKSEYHDDTGMSQLRSCEGEKTC